MVNVEGDHHKKALQQMLREHGLQRQSSLAINLFWRIRDQYHEFVDKTSQPKVLQAIVDFRTNSFLQFLDTTTQSLGGTFDNISAVSGTRHDQAELFVGTCAFAYRLLALRENPENWLVDFLDKYPQFTDDIGGKPEWLEQARE